MLHNATACTVQTDSDETNQRNNQRLISIVELRKIFSVTDMTISRWLKNDRLSFPKPIRIATRRYWYEAEVNEWIADRPRENG